MISSNFATLAEAARQLNHQLDRQPGRKSITVRLPALIFMTDRVRAPDPFAVIARLGPDCAVIFRDYDSAARPLLAQELLNACRANNVTFLVGSDGALAESAGADGLHIPEHLIAEIPTWRQKHANWLITTAAHSAKALTAAHAAGADAALLSPVFATKSHPETQNGTKPTLGADGFALLAEASPLPVYALGGINPENAAKIKGRNVAGLAAIGALALDN
jgi:thiamine-phosphate pyrophosphorylase